MAGETETTHLDNPAAEFKTAGELRRRRRYGENTRRAAAASYNLGRNMQEWGADRGGRLGEAAAAAGELMEDRTRDIAGELRRDRQAAKIENEQQAEGAKEKSEGQSLIARNGTNRALRWAWLNLITTYGLSLFYVLAHVFLRWVFGERFFCKLGHEWLPRQMAKGTHGKILNFFLGIAEIIVLIGLIFLAILLVVLACSVVYLIIDIIIHPISAIWNYGLKAVYAVFRSVFGLN